MAKGEPRWRTWQLLIGAAAGLVLGAAIGLSGASTDREAREDAEQKLATAEQTSEDVNVRAAADRGALEAALRATSTRPPTTTVPPTTLAPTTTTTKTTFGDGSHRVGIDIAPGTYRSTGAGSGNCYWARLSNFTGQDDILANFLSPGPTTVTILASDAGFESRRCGTWTKT